MWEFVEGCRQEDMGSEEVLGMQRVYFLLYGSWSRHG